MSMTMTDLLPASVSNVNREDWRVRHVLKVVLLDRESLVTNPLTVVVRSPHGNAG
jgi:hypothetical protein